MAATKEFWDGGEHAKGKGLTPGIGSAPEHDWSVLVLLGTEDLVELEGKAVEMTDVKRTKVVMEIVVKEGVIDGEVVRLLVCGLLDGLRTMASPLRALAG